MMEFRIWELLINIDNPERGGTFRKTDYFARATKLEHVEAMLNSLIIKLGKPCIIVISKYELNEKTTYR